MRGRQIRPALALSMTVFNAGILTALAADYSYSGFDTYESPEAAKAKLRAEYGENRQTTDDNYDKSLAVKCINGTFVGKKTETTIAYRGIPFVGEQPVGEHRWKAPVDYVPDDGVYEAYYNGKSPRQNESTGENGQPLCSGRGLPVSEHLEGG